MPKKQIQSADPKQVKATAKKPVAKKDLLTAKQVIDWLKKHPDFFIEHPSALTNLGLPVNPGAAISMHQYQVRVLREEKSQLMQKLTALVKNAKTNHKINADLLDLATAMIALSKQGAERAAYLKAIEQHFALFAVHYFDEEESPESFKTIKTLLKKQQSYCSNQNKDGFLKTLFGDDAPAILSLAIVAVKNNKKDIAYLCLAADDADRFTPKMGDAFLLMLARLVASLHA